jgi:hypothetical protein
MSLPPEKVTTHSGRQYVREIIWATGEGRISIDEIGIILCAAWRIIGAVAARLYVCPGV